MTRIYALDANVFIEASHRYYAFDIAPAFWEALVENAKKGNIVTIDRVKQEIERGHDSLSLWMKNNFCHWCDSTNDEDIVNIYGDIMKWVEKQKQFFDKAKYDFAWGADGWLIAYAKAKRAVVVTHEEYNSDIKKRVPIPNVCKEFKVPYINTFQMLRDLNIKFK